MSIYTLAILLVLALSLGLIGFAWFRSPKSHRLARFALLALLVGWLLLNLWGWIQRTWFPGPVVLR